MAITARLVKELRDKTGAGMMDAKKALTETDGDIEAAVDWLRTKGLATAAKKAGRTAAEGLVGVALAADHGVLVEINSETDFVANNAGFQDLVRQVTDAALAVDGDVDALAAASLGTQTVGDTVTEAVARIGENITLRRVARLKGDVLASYVHNRVNEGLGKIGVIVALNGASADQAAEFGRQLAMHVAAAAPLALSEATLDPAVLAHERTVQTARAHEENATAKKPKPEKVINDHVIPGRMKRFLAENTLLGQDFIINPDLTVAAAAKEAGVEITGYVRLAVGEGIERKECDLASEVADALRG